MATVGEKAAANRTAGYNATRRVKQTNKAAVAAQGAPKAERMKATRRSVRMELKAGIRERHPDLKAVKVRNRAAKQLKAVMRQGKK